MSADDPADSLAGPAAYLLAAATSANTISEFIGTTSGAFMSAQLLALVAAQPRCATSESIAASQTALGVVVNPAHDWALRDGDGYTVVPVTVTFCALVALYTVISGLRFCASVCWSQSVSAVDQPTAAFSPSWARSTRFPFGLWTIYRLAIIPMMAMATRSVTSDDGLEQGIAVFMMIVFVGLLLFSLGLPFIFARSRRPLIWVTYGADGSDVVGPLPCRWALSATGYWSWLHVAAYLFAACPPALRQITLHTGVVPVLGACGAVTLGRTWTSGDCNVAYPAVAATCLASAALTAAFAVQRHTVLNVTTALRYVAVAAVALAHYAPASQMPLFNFAVVLETAVAFLTLNVSLGEWLLWKPAERLSRSFVKQHRMLPSSAKVTRATMAREVFRCGGGYDADIRAAVFHEAEVLPLTLQARVKDH